MCKDILEWAPAAFLSVSISADPWTFRVIAKIIVDFVSLCQWHIHLLSRHIHLAYLKVRIPNWYFINNCIDFIVFIYYTYILIFQKIQKAKTTVNRRSGPFLTHVAAVHSKTKHIQWSIYHSFIHSFICDVLCWVDNRFHKNNGTEW